VRGDLHPLQSLPEVPRTVLDRSGREVLLGVAI